MRNCIHLTGDACEPALNGPQTADSVEKVGFPARLNVSALTIQEPANHFEWLFGPSLTFAALLLG